MADHERAMLAYVQLADVSRERQQSLGADKFLVLAGAAACRAGWPDVAERCRCLVAADNPNHLVCKFPSFADAMRSSDFQPFLKQLERLIGYERAEHLLRELDLKPQPPAETAVGTWCLGLLSDPHWESAPDHKAKKAPH
jgi:hypothetical protein